MPRSIHLDPNIQFPPSDPDTWLNRAEAAAALTAAGYEISAATLASKATRGDGPPYRVFNGIAKSRWVFCCNGLKRTQFIAARLY